MSCAEVFRHARWVPHHAMPFGGRWSLGRGGHRSTSCHNVFHQGFAPFFPPCSAAAAVRGERATTAPLVSVSSSSCVPSCLHNVGLSGGQICAACRAVCCNSVAGYSSCLLGTKKSGWKEQTDTRGSPTSFSTLANGQSEPGETAYTPCLECAEVGAHLPHRLVHHFQYGQGSSCDTRRQEQERGEDD